MLTAMERDMGMVIPRPVITTLARTIIMQTMIITVKKKEIITRAWQACLVLPRTSLGPWR